MAENKARKSIVKIESVKPFCWTVEVFVEDMDTWFVYCDGFEYTEEEASKAADECVKYAKQTKLQGGI